MKIEILNKQGELITDFELESNPFKIGETINITVSNHDKEYWNVPEIKGNFKIENVEHFIRKDYISMGRKSSLFVTSVEVSEVI